MSRDLPLSVRDRFELRMSWLDEARNQFQLAEAAYVLKDSCVRLTGRYFRVTKAETFLRDLLDSAHIRFQNRLPVAEEEWSPLSGEGE